MSAAYVIVKEGRGDRIGAGYSGPSCVAAGVTPGRVYQDRDEAQRDAEALTQVNPVGFYVQDYRPAQSAPRGLSCGCSGSCPHSEYPSAGRAE